MTVSLNQDQLLLAIYQKYSNETSFEEFLKNRVTFLQSRVNPVKVHVTGLNLSNLGLTAVPQEIFSFKKLLNLDLSHNDLTKIPDEIAHLQLLGTLDISHNNLFDFPIGVLFLYKLIKLDFSYTYIDSIPLEIVENLTNLRKLRFEHTYFKHFPNHLKNMKNVEIISSFV